MAGGRPAPVTPDGVEDGMIAEDGRTLLLKTASDAREIFVIGSSAARPAPGLLSTDIPLAWSHDGRSVFVQAGLGVPARVEQVDITTGARRFVREVAPPDRTGLNLVLVGQWINDGRAYVYGFNRVLSTLFVVTGVK
jgi:hypothetical protein